MLSKVVFQQKLTYAYFLLQLEYSEKIFNTTATDALTPCVARSSVA